MGMNQFLPSGFESKRKNKCNLARAVREFLGWDLKIASQRSGIESHEISGFETAYIRCYDHHALALREAYNHAGAGWGHASVFLKDGMASDRSAIRAGMALVPMLWETLARDVERRKCIPAKEIHDCLSRWGPQPSPEIVQACIEHLTHDSARLCRFEAGPNGGWRKVGLFQGGAR